MQKLHLVGFTADFEGLIFSTRKGAKSGSFVVPVDARLLKQIAEIEKKRDGGPSQPDDHRMNSPRLVRPESSLSPREMQDRIRAGWSLDEVAAEAGVDLDWVRRFASPVLAEVGRVLEEARDAYFDKARFGLSTLPLGASVRRNVLERGVRMTDEELEDCWSAYQLDDAVWILRFSYLSRGRVQEAEWRYDVETEELTSRNRLATQLGHVTRGRPRKTAAVAPVKPPKPNPKTVEAHKEALAAKVATAQPAPVPARPRAKATKAPARVSARGRAPAAKKSSSKKPSKKPAKKRARAPVEVAAPGTALAPARRPKADGPAWRPTPMPAAAAPARPAPVARAAPPPVARPAPVPEPPPPRRVNTPVPSSSEPPVDEVERPVVVLERRPPPPPPPPPPPLPAPPPRAADRPQPPTGVARPRPAAGSDATHVAATWGRGDRDQPPRPGPVDVDPETGIAHIDSRRMWHQQAPTSRAPVFRDVTVAGDDTPPPPSRLRPRRTEPLRGR